MTATSVLVQVGACGTSCFSGHLPVTTLREVLKHLQAQDSHVLKRLANEQGELNKGFVIFVNEEDVRYLQNLDTPLRDGDEVSIVLAIPGG